MPTATPSNSDTIAKDPKARRRPPRTPKGRQVDPGALADVQALLGDRPRRRDLLIEHLHLIQDHYRQLAARHLAALAQEMRLALAEVDVVLDDSPPPAITVRVCDSLTCAMLGGETLREALTGRLGRDVRVVRAPCMGRCERAPVAEVGHHAIDRATAESVAAAVHGGHTHA